METVTTSGFEGTWTATPLHWSNLFFTQLVHDNYTLVHNLGNPQWKNVENGLLMLTTDLALVEDDDYYDLALEYADSIEALNTAFSAAWQKLTDSGAESGWASNKFCIDGSTLATQYVSTTSTSTTGTGNSSSESSDEEGASKGDDSDAATAWMAVAIVLMIVVVVLLVVVAVLCQRTRKVDEEAQDADDKRTLTGDDGAGVSTQMVAQTSS